MPRRTTAARGRAQRAKPRTERRAAGGSFRCAGCRLDVSLDAPGTAHRNHCPTCLVSLHVDGRIPGDRAAGCGAPMDAVSLTVRADGEWLLIHQCRRCAALSTNRIAGDDNALALLRLALRPLRDGGLGHRALLAF